MTDIKNATPLAILVEGALDKEIVEHLLVAMNADAANQVKVFACGGKARVKDEFHRRTETREKVIALVDADAPSVADSVGLAQKYLGTFEKNVFCAVPSTEAWIFADKELALRHARKRPYAISTINRIVTPESLMNPKILINQVFDREIISEKFPFLRGANIGRAVATSISLFEFLRGVESSLGHPWPYVEQQLSTTLNRTVFANLLREIPSKTIGWRTLDGEYTAAQLGDLVLQGDELGLRYISDLLRLARDILAARAQDRSSDDA